jgi:hypothetical protein
LSVLGNVTTAVGCEIPPGMQQQQFGMNAMSPSSSMRRSLTLMEQMRRKSYASTSSSHVTMDY